jgi:hypothetical protein
MLIGTRITAPNGLGSLPKDVPHHFLINHAATERVLLARFDWRGKGAPKAIVIALDRADFEAAAGQGEIRPTEQQPTMPPWLTALEGENLGRRDGERNRSKQSHAARIERRLLLISRAIEDLPKILASDDVTQTLNRYAREASPPQNEARFRLWVLTYVCFGRNIWSLLPPFHLAGKWDRKRLAPKKMGAPSLAYGKGHGYGMSEEMAKLCDRAYSKFMEIGKPMKDIYEEGMRKVFGCAPVMLPSKRMVYSHPLGKPFPSLRQFRYQIEKSFGKTVVQKNRFGSVRHRNRLAPTIGSYSEDIANLMEKVEADGYSTDERPKGYLEGSVLEPICVVTGRDLLAGMKLGIGFSFGAELGAAYRMMLFCMAVPKDYFFRLWGLTFDLHDWPSQGLPPHYKVDLGPGSSLNLVEEDAKPAIRNLVEAWSGQSKATVESSHPRKAMLEGQPTYFETSYTPVELCRREITKLVTYNHTADMSDRMEIDPQLASVLPTPNEIWNHYDARGRNSGLPMSIDNAVRSFLTPRTFKCTKAGVFWNGLRYDSKELRECGLLEKIARAGGREVPIQGYTMEVGVRYIWIEVDRQILLLGAQLKIREDDKLLDVSCAELEQRQAAMAKTASEMREHIPATTTHYIQSFESQTGLKWEQGKRRYGRPKKDATSRQEILDVQQHTAKRKSA